MRLLIFKGIHDNEAIGHFGRNIWTGPHFTFRTERNIIFKFNIIIDKTIYKFNITNKQKTNNNKNLQYAIKHNRQLIDSASISKLRYSFEDQRDITGINKKIHLKENPYPAISKTEFQHNFKTDSNQTKLQSRNRAVSRLRIEGFKRRIIIIDRNMGNFTGILP